MKHILAVAVLWIAAVAVIGGLVGCGGSEEPPADPEISDNGTFFSDSLGVALALPESPGWSLRRDPAIPGGSYITAFHESEKASVRLFVTPHELAPTLDDVVKRRRDQLAGLFGVSDLDQVIARVMVDKRETLDGFPALQWQAMTEPVGVAGEDPARIVFMWAAAMRESNAYEVVGVVRSPAQATAEQAQVADALLGDVARILQTFQVR